MLVITGNPGVGKKTVAKIVAKKLSLEIADINEIAIKNNTIKSKDNSGYIVDLQKLSLIMRKHVSGKGLVVGHLAPYVLKKNDPTMVAVIRRSPYELKKVYKKRGYDVDKAAENLSSEIIGVCLYDTIKRFGENKVAEFDNTSKSSAMTADKIIGAFKGKTRFSVGKIDWLSLIVKNNDVQKFFQYRYN